MSWNMSEFLPGHGSCSHLWRIHVTRRHFVGWRPCLFFPLKSSNLWYLCHFEGDNHGFFLGFGTLSTTVSGWGCWKTERGGDESAQTPGIHSDGLNRQVFGGNNAHLGRAISVRWETVAFGVYREYFGVCSDNVVVSKSWIFWFLTCLFSIAEALLLYLVTSKGTSPGWKSRSLCKLLPTYQRKAWRNHYTVHLHLGVSENRYP